ncbi:hypothetical protein BHE74_00012881 [Ensete ventricosum]|nr:hypothetical protein BHE74_00012881 [Ensete ventricosum]
MDTARTGRYVPVRSLPGGTVVWGCFCPVTTQNRLVTVNFGRRRLLSGSNGRFRPSVADFGRYQPREKKRENLESGAALPIPIRRPRVIFSPRAGRRNVSLCKEKEQGAAAFFLNFLTLSYTYVPSGSPRHTARYKQYGLYRTELGILERKPELTTEVMAFRDYLLSSTVSDTLEVWELKGIDEL